MINQSPLFREQYESDEKYQEALLFAQSFVGNALRTKRNKLLSDSDWTQFADSPLTGEQKAAWAAYRQSLRDYPSNTVLDFESGFVIDDSSFPQKPE